MRAFFSPLIHCWCRLVCGKNGNPEATTAAAIILLEIATEDLISGHALEGRLGI